MSENRSNVYKVLGLGKDAIEKESKIIKIYWKRQIDPMDR